LIHFPVYLKVMFNKSPISLLVGTIVGVGIFALPFIALTAGFWLTIFYLVALGIVSGVTLLAYSRIIISTPGNHRLIGYTKIHLGLKWSKVLSFTHILSLLATQLAYLTIGGLFLSKLLSFPLQYGVLSFFVVGALLIYFDSEGVNLGELLMTELMYLIIIVLFVFSVPHFHLSNLLGSGTFSFHNAFLPYGVALFAMWGSSVMPELVDSIGKDMKRLRGAVIASLLIVLLIYIAFIVSVLGSSGASTSSEAIAGLEALFPRYVIFIALLFGFLATITSFLGLGLLLKKTFTYDLGIKKGAWFWPTVIPLIGFIVGITSYLSLISIVGAVFIGFEAIVIYLMYIRVKDKELKTHPFHYFSVILIILILLIGIGLGIQKDISSLHTSSMSRTPAPLPNFVQPTQQITLITIDKWKLAGNYYVAEKPKSGVVLVHMYGRTQSDWASLIPKLLKAHISVVTYDSRGHGQSQGEYQNFTVQDFQRMNQDVYVAEEFLKSKLGGKHISLVGASLGANNVLRFASLTPSIYKVVALSPGLDYRGLYATEYIRSLKAYTLIIASKKDDYSFSSSEKIFATLPSPETSRFIKLEGDAHGTNMLDEIGDKIVLFLNN